MSIRLLSAMLAVACLAACSPVGTRKPESPVLESAYQRHEAQVGAVEDWELDGRLALSDGKEGGSGVLSWIQEGDTSKLAFRGTMGRGAWQLEADGSGAVLELANGEVYRDASVAELVRKRVGWKVPVDALQWWVRGLASPGKLESRELDETGKLVRLEQSGWTVNFSQYRDEGEAWMPGKLNARRENYTVKVVVKNWRINGEDPPIE